MGPVGSDFLETTYEMGILQVRTPQNDPTFQVQRLRKIFVVEKNTSFSSHAFFVENLLKKEHSLYDLLSFFEGLLNITPRGLNMML